MRRAFNTENSTGVVGRSEEAEVLRIGLIGIGPEGQGADRPEGVLSDVMNDLIDLRMRDGIEGNQDGGIVPGEVGGFPPVFFYKLR